MRPSGILAPFSTNMNQSIGASSGVRENSNQELKDKLNELKAKLGKMKQGK